VSGWEPGHGRGYDFGDRTVDFFAHGYDGLINFGFKREAAGPLDDVFTRYAAALRGGALQGVAILNYVSSHDDGAPYDRERKDPLGAGTRLLLAPGGAQIYYGDEVARPLSVTGAQGDANLRSPMNWSDLQRGGAAGILEHWRKLSRFRRDHPAVGAGEHRRLQEKPYVFSRALERNGVVDVVIVAMDQPGGMKTIPVSDVFPEGAELVDGYSGARGTVVNGAVSITSPFDLVLLSERREWAQRKSRGGPLRSQPFASTGRWYGVHRSLARPARPTASTCAGIPFGAGIARRRRWRRANTIVP
jgi:alpha-amylase